MCLTVLEGTRIRKAKEDIPVYKKILWYKTDKGIIFKAYIIKSEYKIGTLYPKVPLVSKYSRKEVYEGYHSYSSENHSVLYYIKGDSTKSKAGAAVGKFIIPKGSKYYIGRNQDLVSDQIFFEGVLRMSNGMMFTKGLKEGQMFRIIGDKGRGTFYMKHKNGYVNMHTLEFTLDTNDLTTCKVVTDFELMNKYKKARPWLEGWLEHIKKQLEKRENGK